MQIYICVITKKTFCFKFTFEPLKSNKIVSASPRSKARFFRQIPNHHSTHHLQQVIKVELLGWMHRKFRQNSSEQLKDFAMSLLDDQQIYSKPNYGTKPSVHPRETIFESHLLLCQHWKSSHVSAGRSSHGSTITLSGKPIEGSDTNGNGTTVCPLQETTTVAKKEHRTSLGELFQRTKITEENVGGKYDKEEKRTEKEGDKSAVHIMKKMLKKKMLNASRSSTAATEGNIDSASAETKLHKILHMFHRKVSS
ncbi:hypothetical protein ES319_D02G168200v1 [Gossypium barbadense]|uniref:Uncharacterized protein n=1 Tax=Gossypium barbadense TaxID=3634 RepID=A0A5J5SGU4_GOSBA|nr:hypothetical protein ES319_D02G168200v1 [Gossypium barbadense]